MKYKWLLFCFLFTLCGFTGVSQHAKINAITFVGTPSPYSDEAMKEIKELGFSHICLVPYGFMKKNGPKIWYNIENQWWGERKEGIEHSFKLAKKLGISTILKPQIWMHDLWVGDLYFDDEEKRCAWESNFQEFTFHFLDMAIVHDVDIFCLGTEYKLIAKRHPEFWKSLIGMIRSKYGGKLTYSANWDEFEDISFWNDLDYIGISGYFPLLENENPSSTELIKEWKPIKANLQRFSERYDKPILFSEYGYLSVSGCAGKTWELEKKVRSLDIDNECQAKAIKALWDSFGSESFWAGGILWKWFPDGMGHEGYPERDYTPQGKKAEEVLRGLGK